MLIFLTFLHNLLGGFCCCVGMHTRRWAHLHCSFSKCPSLLLLDNHCTSPTCGNFLNAYTVTICKWQGAVVVPVMMTQDLQRRLKQISKIELVAETNCLRKCVEQSCDVCRAMCTLTTVSNHTHAALCERHSIKESGRD